MSIPLARILVGALLLVLGRRLFWLFVGGVGFVAGMEFADRFLQGQPTEVVIIFAVIVGLIGMALAIFLRKMALVAAGFLAGGYLLLHFTAAVPTVAALTRNPALAFLAGGVAGALLINTVFNLTLIVLSSLGGASLICGSLKMDPQISAVVFVALAIAGIMAQAGLLRRLRGGLA